MVSIDDIPATIEPPPEFIIIFTEGGSISKLFDKDRLFDSNSAIFLLSSTALSLFTPA